MTPNKYKKNNFNLLYCQKNCIVDEFLSFEKQFKICKQKLKRTSKTCFSNFV